MSISLLSSGLLGTQILLTDKWLWSAAQTHAIGLLGFVVIDLALGLAVWWRTPMATVGGGLASALQLAAMIADMSIGQPMDVAASAFRSYLLNDSSYLLLLFAQVPILTIAISVSIAVHSSTRKVADSSANCQALTQALSPPRECLNS